MSIEELVKKLDIQITLELGGNKALPVFLHEGESEDSFDGWRVHLTRKEEDTEHTLALDFFTGEFYRPGSWYPRTIPTAEHVLSVIYDDIHGVQNAGSLEEWAEDFRLDPENNEVVRAWDSILTQEFKVRKFFGKNFQEFMA